MLRKKYLLLNNLIAINVKLFYHFLQNSIEKRVVSLMQTPNP